MKYLKLLKNNESYDSWIKSDNAGFPNVAVLDFSNENYSQNNSIFFTKKDPTPPLPPSPPPPACPIPEEGLEIYETYNCPADLLEINTQNGIALFNYFAALCPNNNDTYTLPDNELVVVTYDSYPHPTQVRLTTEKISYISRYIYSGINGIGQQTNIDVVQCYLIPYTYMDEPGGSSYFASIGPSGHISIDANIG